MTGKDMAEAIAGISDPYLMEAMIGISNAVAEHPGEELNMKARKMHSVKRIGAIAAAACLLLALGITAFASGFSFAAWFQRVFPGLPAQDAVYEQLSAGEITPCTSNGTTITPIAAIADNTMCYIRLRIDAPEDTELHIPDRDTEGYLHLSGRGNSSDLLVNTKTGKGESGEAEFIWMDDIPGDNSLDVVIIYSGMIGDTHFTDHKVRTVNIHGIWLQDSAKNYSLVLDGDWSFDLAFPAAEPKELDVKGLEAYRLIDGEICNADEVTLTLTRMTVSPLSLDVTYRYTTADQNVIPDPGTILVVLKDGTEVTSNIGSAEGENDWMHFTCILDTPIDVSEVDFIQFGSQQISVN